MRKGNKMEGKKEEEGLAHHVGEAASSLVSPLTPHPSTSSSNGISLKPPLMPMGISAPSLFYHLHSASLESMSKPGIATKSDAFPPQLLDDREQSNSSLLPSTLCRLEHNNCMVRSPVVIQYLQS